MLMLNLRTTQMKNNNFHHISTKKIPHIAKLKTFQKIEVKNWSNTFSTKLLFKVFSNLNIFSFSFFPKHKTTRSSWTIVAIYIYIYTIEPTFDFYLKVFKTMLQTLFSLVFFLLSFSKKKHILFHLFHLFFWTKKARSW